MKMAVLNACSFKVTVLQKTHRGRFCIFKNGLAPQPDAALSTQFEFYHFAFFVLGLFLLRVGVT